jgi:hypothetical protein
MVPILMHQMRISTTQVSSVTPRSKKLEIWKKCDNWKSRRMKTKQSAMKLSQKKLGLTNNSKFHHKPHLF